METGNGRIWLFKLQGPDTFVDQEGQHRDECGAWVQDAGGTEMLENVSDSEDDEVTDLVGVPALRLRVRKIGTQERRLYAHGTPPGGGSTCAEVFLVCVTAAGVWRGDEDVHKSSAGSGITSSNTLSGPRTPAALGSTRSAVSVQVTQAVCRMNRREPAGDASAGRRESHAYAPSIFYSIILLRSTVSLAREVLGLVNISIIPGMIQGRILAMAAASRCFLASTASGVIMNHGTFQAADDRGVIRRKEYVRRMGGVWRKCEERAAYIAAEAHNDVALGVPLGYVFDPGNQCWIADGESSRVSAFNKPAPFCEACVSCVRGAYMRGDPTEAARIDDRERKMYENAWVLVARSHEEIDSALLEVRREFGYTPKIIAIILAAHLKFAALQQARELLYKPCSVWRTASAFAVPRTPTDTLSGRRRSLCAASYKSDGCEHPAGSEHCRGELDRGKLDGSECNLDGRARSELVNLRQGRVGREGAIEDVRGVKRAQDARLGEAVTMMGESSESFVSWTAVAEMGVRELLCKGWRSGGWRTVLPDSSSTAEGLTYELALGHICAVYPPQIQCRKETNVA
ncbi:hypothetical protein CERSUDRAFT_127337 [Gelatoporia subvermispora B]|uniref:Uncharacterized protein n=1 Tax=Ceriporiopsis subvermispora (strain B) TaxID=914234 RepID=M2QHD0_CERS8|nr:hypothetical protein CERSUDRAFT_127337 [Gelatoporia subvermispora B]